MIKCMLVLSLLTFANINCARILGIFPLPFRSNHVLGSALLKELAVRGHKVTMLSAFPLKNPPKNYQDINLAGLLEWKEKNMRMYNADDSITDTIKLAISSFTMISQILENEALQEFLKTEPKFDLVIQSWVLSESLLGIGHAVNGTTIAFSALGSSQMSASIASAPSPYSYVPHTFKAYTDKMTFFERVGNTIAYVGMDIFMNVIFLPYQRRLFHKHFPESPPLDELMDNVDLVLMNSHYATETPRPYLPNMIQIGGFHLQEKETLSDDLKQYLDTSKHGVIFFSLGSNVETSDMSDVTIREILAAFSKLKYDILWKFNDNLPNKPSNVKISKWLPQRAILQHPNVVAFLTHGGLGSTVEAVFFGVPMICIPLFGDQEKNVADTVRNGYGIRLQITNVTEETLTSTIVEITENPIYRNNIQLRSDLYKNQEMNPMDKAVYWVEHALKYKGAKHFKPMADKLSWYQYMLLDVITFITCVIVTWCAFMYYICKKMFSLFCRKNKKVAIIGKVKKN